MNGAQIEGLPEGSYVITTTPAQPGETLTYTVKLTGQNTGTGTLTTTMVSDVVAGKTIVRTNVKVTKK